VSNAMIEDSEDRTNEASAPEESGSRELDRALEELHTITRNLRGTTGIITFITLIHIALSLSSMVFAIVATDTSRYSTYYDVRPVLIFFEIAILVAILALLLWYDRKISKGDALYQEISDELEWNIRTTKKRLPVKESRFIKDRPGLSVRLLLREFVLSSRLPLVRGNQGVAYYLALNVLLTLLSLFTLALKAPISR
jgi:hypothetical protein